MKRALNFLSLFFLFFNLTVFSQNQFDTLAIRDVGRGVLHISIKEPNVPWTIDILKIDLTKSILKIEAGISKDRIRGFEKTSAMANRYNHDGHHVVGAVNGGFFDGNGHDVGMQIREGEVVTYATFGSKIAFDTNNVPMIERTILQSEVILNDGLTSTPIHGVNRDRDTDQLILYNQYFGTSTNTNQWGCEIEIKPIAGWLANDTVKCVVVNKTYGVGNSNISKGNAILSGHGSSRDFIDSTISIGDTIFVLHKMIPAIEKINTLLNGYPRIVIDGANCALACFAEEGGSGSFATARHPRTAAGYSQDKRYLYLVTVDGRQPSSRGMTLSELADYLIGLGVYRAVNLDGGGSSTMVVRNRIVNSPSDNSGERSVSNSLMVVSLDYKGELTQINLNTIRAKVFAKQNYQFRVAGSDEHYNSFPITTSNVQYSLSHNFGTITNSGLFTAGEKVDTGYVIAEYETMKDSALVVVNSIVRLEITPEFVLADTTNEIQFDVGAYDLNGWRKNLSNDNFNWLSTNGNVGTIDSLGKFLGLSEGSTKIIVEWGSISDTAIVNIELKEGTSILNSFDSIDKWYLSGKDIDTVKSFIEITNENFTEGSSSLKLNYSFTYLTGIQNWAYLNTNIPTEGIPYSFEIDVNANDYKHSIAFIVTNYSGEEFALLTNKTLDVDEKFDTLTVKLDAPIPLEPNNIFHFPIVIKQIAVILSSGRGHNATYEGSILFDNLRVNYSDPQVSVEPFDKPVSSFVLYQNYPNPFNPTTTIQYSIPRIEGRAASTINVVLKIYDVLGRVVETLVDENKGTGNYSIVFDAGKLSSGVYYYKLIAGDFSDSKKMILLR